MRKVTEVAAAVIERPDGLFLLACRPEGKPYPGYWEFPGGKIEPGESPREALVRELKEELGIEAREASPWITRMYVYTHATVRLHFFRVTAWEGEPQSLEGQAIAWQHPLRPDVTPMLPANGPVLAALALPSVMVVSDAQSSPQDWTMRLAALASRERVLIQIREKSMTQAQIGALLALVHGIAGPAQCPVVVNSDCGRFAGAGVHLTSSALRSVTARPDVPLVGASCHTTEDLAHAAALGLDYALLGHVNPTASHPGAQPLGWETFEALCRDQPMPIYAIGGLARADLPEAKRRGAHGVALRSAAFDVGQ